MKPWQVAAAGCVSLAVAMGIGRFAFTPLLPMMLADGSVDLHTASWLASANYFGYLVGALLCMLQPWIWRRLAVERPLRPPAWVRGGLIATGLVTAAMALQLSALWPVLRFAAGVASAFVFVYTSGWCLAQMSRLGAPAMGALIYTGPGLGIVVSGLAASALVAGNKSAQAGWLIFGLLSAVLTAFIWRVFRPGTVDAAATMTPAVAPDAAAINTGAPGRCGSMEIALFAFAYGLAGFGYIITATFLPVIARQALPASHWLDLFWPIFGAAVVLGALGASRLHVNTDMRWLLAGGFAIEAIGVACSLVSPTLAGFAIGSFLLGLPFTALTFFAMQEARRLRPAQASSTMGLLTAMYGVGQIVGPTLAAALLARGSAAGQSFDLSLEIAAAALSLGALIFCAMVRLYPLRQYP